MEIKRIIKNIYTVFMHPALVLFNGRIGKNFFLGQHALVKGKKYLSIGNNVRIGDYFQLRTYDLFAGEKYSPSVEIEDECYIGERFKVLANDSVIIKKGSLIAGNVFITTENHSIERVDEGEKYGNQPLTHEPIEIGEYSWIGENVIILPGVKIGKWSVIGAGSVVTKSIPDYTIAVGNPAKPIKRSVVAEDGTRRWTNIKNEKEETK